MFKVIYKVLTRVVITESLGETATLDDARMLIKNGPTPEQLLRQFCKEGEEVNSHGIIKDSYYRMTFHEFQLYWWETNEEGSVKVLERYSPSKEFICEVRQKESKIYI